MSQPFFTGLDVLAREDFSRVRAHKLAILCHPASVDRGFVHIIDHVARAKLQVAALFGPEHGLTGFAQDMASVDGAPRHPRLGCPVYSLYGESEASLAPAAEMLGGVEAVLIDLQDVGSRYYTFVWTAVMMMRACAAAKIKIVVLDRPNPLGGEAVEGGGVDENFRSFVGHYDVPVRHGLSVGEMLKLVAHEERLSVDLEIVRCENWRREAIENDGRYSWVLPSPNMPTLDTARVYPGGCLLEATNLSEGRGTTRPFEIVGAAFIDGEKWAAALNALGEPGVSFRALEFKPMFHKFAGKICGGVQLHITSFADYSPFRAGVRLVQSAAEMHPAFAWRADPYEFVADKNAFDLLTGSDAYRLAFHDRNALAEVLAAREAQAMRFRARRQAALLY